MNVEMDLTGRELGCRKEAKTDEESQGPSAILLGAATDLHGIGDQVFGGQPLFDVIGGDPGREIAKKNGKTHSVDLRLR